MKKLVSVLTLFLLFISCLDGSVSSSLYDSIYVYAAQVRDVSTFSPSEDAISLIKGSEGCSEECFWDNLQWSIGYGSRCPYTHTQNGTYWHQPGNHYISKSEALNLFNDSVLDHVNRVYRDCRGISMTQNQFDALLSAAYNHGNVIDCPLKYYLQGKLTETEAKEKYYVWCINQGTKDEIGLRNRRKREAALFFRDSPDTVESLVTPKISTDKNTFTFGDTVNITWQESPANSNLSHYWLQIFQPDGSMILNETMNRNTSYSFKPSQTGEYHIVAFATPLGSKEGEGSLTDEISITVKNSKWYDDLNPANLGDTFDAIILNTNNRKPIRSEEGNIVLHKEEWTTNEMWRFNRLSDGSYTITNFDNLLCMDAYDSGTEIGTNISVYSSNGNPNQKWFIYGVEGGYVFRPSYCDLVMDLAGNESADGTNIWLHGYFPGNTAQIYSIYTNSSTQYAKPCPEKPTLSVESDTSIRISWERTMYTEKYIVYRCFGNADWKAIGETKDTSYIDNNLAANSKYSYKYESISKFYKEESYVSSATTKNHNYIDTLIPPTCTEKGYTLRKCTLCDLEIKIDEKAKISHNYKSELTNDKHVYMCTECGNTFEVPFEGSGTHDDPYQISSRYDLEVMRDLVNDEETEMRNKCYIQTVDIDLENIEFEPIGGRAKTFFSEKCLFGGTYNGGNHQIFNLKITGTQDDAGIGLFSSLNGEAVVENLVVYGEIESDSQYVGGICGRVVNGKAVKIRNCGFIGNITANAGAGGIVGGIANQCEILNCYHIGEIDSDAVGGIVGYFSFWDSTFFENTDKNLLIQNCYHSGILNQETKYCGGITGGFVLMSDDYIILVKNCFYNKANAPTGMYGNWKNSEIAALSSNLLRQTANELGESFVTNTDSDFLDGYPVFSWQIDTHKSKTGDLNADGKCSSIDVVIFRQWMLGIMDEDDDLLAADMNDDGKVNIVDFCLLNEAIIS